MLYTIVLLESALVTEIVSWLSPTANTIPDWLENTGVSDVLVASAAKSTLVVSYGTNTVYEYVSFVLSLGTNTGSNTVYVTVGSESVLVTVILLRLASLSSSVGSWTTAVIVYSAGSPFSASTEIVYVAPFVIPVHVSVPLLVFFAVPFIVTLDPVAVWIVISLDVVP